MDQLVSFVVQGLVDNPDEVEVSKVEGDATVMLELSVHEDDVDLVKGDDGETLRHLRAVLAAASGRRKAILELVEGGGESGEE